MSFTAEQKSQLAKLLATENLTVQHQKLSTAKFDPQNRILYLPIWQDMTGVIYDLLVGHEVGHALYTPADGWHDAVVDESKPKSYKGFLNVVEDARIEKKVKRKYPGLSTAFKSAYQELHKRDFFGIADRDVNEMPFIDRLNLFSKSQWTSTWINFTAQEEVMVKKVQAIETWEDVVRVTDEIFAYSKNEQQELMMHDFDNFNFASGDDDYDYDDIEQEENDYGQPSKEASDGKNAENESDDANGDGDGDGNSEDDGDEDDMSGKAINHNKYSSDSEMDQFNPTCETDHNYRSNEVKLLDEKSKEWVYVNIPKPIMKNIITPIDVVQSDLTKFYREKVTEGYFEASLPLTLVKEFKQKNERYIGLLAKEFEMRKAAKAFNKSKLCDTGDIDINKLSSYKFDDNIFRKVMLVPKGKSHGLVLLLDKSGSMSNNMPGSIEQILVLAMFCRKVNIPFVVYGFGNSVDAYCYDRKFTPAESYDFNRGSEKYASFERQINDIEFGNVRLREYLNNRMTNAEFTEALKNMLMVKKSFESRDIPRSPGESLSNTPLVQAVTAMAKIMKDFKKSNNLDMTSLVIIHDGDSDWLNHYVVEKEKEIYNAKNEKETIKVKCNDYFDMYKTLYIIRDPANKFEFKYNGNEDCFMQNVLKWFTHVTGSKVFGFFILPPKRGDFRYHMRNRYHTPEGKTLHEIYRGERYKIDEEVAKLQKQFKAEKFIESKNVGFNSFFFVAGGEELTTEEDEIEIEGKFTAKKLATAFAKYNKKKAVNRVLVSRFIQGIAA